MLAPYLRAFTEHVSVPSPVPRVRQRQRRTRPLLRCWREM
jgi:hypothetical protein